MRAYKAFRQFVTDVMYLAGEMRRWQIILTQAGSSMYLFCVRLEDINQREAINNMAKGWDDAAKGKVTTN